MSSSTRSDNANTGSVSGRDASLSATDNRSTSRRRIAQSSRASQVTEQPDESGGEAGRLYNSVALVGAEGVIARYRKIHTGGVEKCLWNRGDRWGVNDPSGSADSAMAWRKTW